MKKKITIGVMLGITSLTAIIMLCMFTSPVFYNTDYTISENGGYCGYIRIVDGHTVEYYQNETDIEPIVYDCVISGNTLTFRHYTFKIHNKFKLVLKSNANCIATPAGGGAALFATLMFFNIPVTTALVIMLCMWINKRYSKPKNNIKEFEHITYCSKCGYQLFKEDNKCPYCSKPKE